MNFRAPLVKDFDLSAEILIFDMEGRKLSVNGLSVQSREFCTTLEGSLNWKKAKQEKEREIKAVCLSFSLRFEN